MVQVTAMQVPTAHDGAVHQIQVDLDGASLSGLVSEPVRTPPRAVVVALHGAGMSAGYFHGDAHPDVSLADLGRCLGFTVLTIDRPGYGSSAAAFPHGQSSAQQASIVYEALVSFAQQRDVGAGFFLLAHSFGGKVALSVAANRSDVDLIGLDISGCGFEYAAPDEGIADHGPHHWRKNWGAPRLYPPGTFRSSRSVISPVPDREREDALRWPDAFPDVASRVRVPVRFTFAEQESWWRHDASAVTDLKARFVSSPRVLIDRQPDSGHNISLGWSARAYHLKALGFLEECLASDRCLP